MSFKLVIRIEVSDILILKSVIFPFKGAFSFISLEVVPMELMRLVLFAAHTMEPVVEEVSLVIKPFGVELALPISHIMLEGAFII